MAYPGLGLSACCLHLLQDIVYLVDLIAKTYKVISRGVGEFGIDVRSLGKKVKDVLQEEPDPHLFLITADLRPE